MAQFFGLVTLNADSFDSEDAASGEVLTADGSGGAAFAAPTGSGGGGYLETTFQADWNDDGSFVADNAFPYVMALFGLNVAGDDDQWTQYHLLLWEPDGWRGKLFRYNVEGWGVGGGTINGTLPGVGTPIRVTLSVWTAMSG